MRFTYLFSTCSNLSFCSLQVVHHCTPMAS